MLNTQELAALSDSGYVHCRDIIDTTSLSKLEKIFYDKRDSLDCYSNWAYMGIFRESKDYLDFIKESPVLSIAKQVLGAKVELYWDSVVTKEPKTGKAFLWHQDSGYSKTEPYEYFTFWIPFHKTNIENGCLWAAPGSHKNGLLPHISAKSTDLNYPGKQIYSYGSENEVALEMQVGDLLVFNSFLAHRSGVNKSKLKRSALAFAVHKQGFKEIELPPGLKPFPGLALN